MSGKGKRIPLHYDDGMTHNIVSNIIGEKEFLLFEPDQGPLLYPKSDEYLVSQIPDPFSVSVEKFPMFASARPDRVTLGPGESLFVPCGWRSEEHTAELQSLMRSSYAVFCLKKITPQ